MHRAILGSFLIVGWLAAIPVRAVVIDDGTPPVVYNTSEPTESDVSGWTTGWGAAGVTGWDYVGQVKDASGVYLGNGWVLTVGHVGAADFVLNGVTYVMVANSAQSLLDSNGTADAVLFQIATQPALPSLTINISAPELGATVVMTGYGGGQGETWGANAVTDRDIPVHIDGFNFDSTDFATVYGGSSLAKLVVGDSGGGDFIHDAGGWYLAGINEGVDGAGDSFMVQLNTYASQISATTGITVVPEPRETMEIVLLAAAGLGAARKWRDGKQDA